MTYPVIYQGERWTRWVQPHRTEYALSCCDCGLVHGMQFRVKNGRIQFRAQRRNRSTAQLRRWRDYPAKPDVEDRA